MSRREKTPGVRRPAPEERLARMRGLLGKGDSEAAAQLGAALCAAHPEDLLLLRLQGKTLEALGDYAAALELAQRAVQLRPRNVRARLRLARCLWRNGQVREALDAAALVARTARARPGALLRVAEFYEEIGDPQAAQRCRSLAHSLAPQDPRALAALAESAVAAREWDKAEGLFDEALFHDPEQLHLLERRTRLRRISEEDHRANQLGYVLDRLAPDDPRRAPVCYALAQELEDLGHHEPAFGIWREGARCRRLAFEASPGGASAALDAVEAAFDAQWLTGIEEADRGRGLVFVAGLPGSGQDLLSGLLSSSAPIGVVRDTGLFADAVTRITGPMADRAARWRVAAAMAPAELAQAYRQALGGLAGMPRQVVDIETAHVSLLGLLRAAFPAATLVHLRRDPLDHCLSLFTTLFPKGVAWSYSLDDLGRYYSRYHRLMGHWRRHLPGGFIDLDYETLVRSPAESLQLILGPDLSSGSEAAAANPFDPTAWWPRGGGVGRWRQYEAQLKPLIDRLRADGVPIA